MGTGASNKNNNPIVASMQIQDTDASNDLTIDWNENDSSDRNLYFKVNSGERTIDLGDDLTYPYTDVLEVAQNGQYTSVATAVTACTGGEVVLVYPGTYTETVTFGANDITVLGMGKPNEVIITQANANVVDWIWI